MKTITYNWSSGGVTEAFNLAFVRGTQGQPYSFGEGADRLSVEIDDFFVGTVPVTQALWVHLMGADANRSARRGPDLPLENVSWDELTRRGGFLDRVNASPMQTSLSAQIAPPGGTFRLPSETEWEYAARGGPHWRDGFRFSGSDDVDAVAWHGRKWGDHTQPVARKAPNQLGIYDMSGNVWEWCQDVFTRDVAQVPRDGTPFTGAGEERVLRGGCFHNWGIHCRVSKRYEMAHDFHDGCIGVRLVFALSSAAPSR